jgi:hypothetical protein
MWGAACAKLQPPELRRESSSGSRPTGVASSVGLNTRAAPDKPRGGSGRAQAAGTAQHQAPPRRGVGGAADGGGAVRPSGVAHGKSGSSLHGQRISIEAAHGVVPAVEYAPAEGAKLVGCVLLTPGSGGGLGPGVAIHPQPFDDIRKPAAVGAIYTRLGMELSTGRQVRRCCSDGAHVDHPAHNTIDVGWWCCVRTRGTQVTWAYQPTGEAIPELAGGNKSADPTKPRYTIAVVQVRSAVACVGAGWCSVSQAAVGRRQSGDSNQQVGGLPPSVLTPTPLTSVFPMEHLLLMSNSVGVRKCWTEGACRSTGRAFRAPSCVDRTC